MTVSRDREDVARQERAVLDARERTRWWPRYGGVVLGVTAGSWASELLEGDAVTRRDFIVWPLSLAVALAVVWILYRLVDAWRARRREAQS